MRLDRPNEALRQFEHAAEINSEQPDVYYLLAGAYRRLGQPEKSQAAIGKFQILSDKTKKASTEPGRARWSSPACISAWGGVQH